MNESPSMFLQITDVALFLEFLRMHASQTMRSLLAICKKTQFLGLLKVITAVLYVVE